MPRFPQSSSFDHIEPTNPTNVADSRPASVNTPRQEWTDSQEQAFVAHVREKTSELDADDLFTIRSAIPSADRGTATALSRLELASFIERLQDDIQTGVDRLLEEGMISTFSAAQSVEIMFPAQPEQSPTLSEVIFLDTENQVDNRDDLLVRLNEPGRSIPPTSGDQYDCSVLMSYLHGTGGSELRSYRDVLARIRPRFDPLLNEQDAGNLPTDEELTTVYNQLSRLSHQMVCVSMLGDAGAQ